jgi:hypothetical protein
MKRAMLYISAICFTEIASADVSLTEHAKISCPDALYVNTHSIPGIIPRNGTGSFKNTTYITPLHPYKKEQGSSASLAIHAIANPGEENSLRKKSRKKHPFAMGKDDLTYNPNFKKPRVLPLKIPP